MIVQKNRIRDRKFIIFITYLVNIAIFITPVVIKLTQIDEKQININEISTSFEKKIYIAVMSGASLKDAIAYTYSQWYEILRFSNFSSGVGFYIDGTIQNNGGDIPYHFINDPEDISTHKLISKLFSALKFFLENTNAGWFLRICEDTVVNLETFPEFLSELNENFNPYQDFVIQGACLGKTNSTYMQGGSGFVFSRRAALKIFEDYKWFRDASHVNKADDRLLGYYLDELKVPPANYTSRWFLGHSFFRRTSAYEAIANLTDVPACTEPVSRKGCRRFFTRVKDITFWHDRVKFDDFVVQYEKIRQITPDNLYFYVPINKPVLCIGNESTKSGYYD